MKNFLILLSITLLFGCSKNEGSPITKIDSPAGDNASLPHLNKAPDGSIYLSWIEKVKTKTSC